MDLMKKSIEALKVSRAGGPRVQRVTMLGEVQRRAADGADALRIRVTTGDLDRYNSKVDPKGWRTENYMKNAVVLWMHNMWEPPVAKTVKLEADDNGLVATPEFADRKSHPLAGTVEDLVRAGFINAASVSWDPIKWAYDEERGGVDFIENELLEWSFVTVPGNAGALIERAAAEGIDVDPLREMAERVIRAAGDKSAEAIARAGKAKRTYVLVRGFGDDTVELRTDSLADLSAASTELNAHMERKTAAMRADAPAEEPVDAMKCSGCGEPFDDDDKFCSMCGAKREEPAAEKPADEEPPAEAPTEEAAIVDAIRSITFK